MNDYKDRQNERRDMHKMGYKPKECCVENPFREFPRNSPCPCESGKKFKNCHLSSMKMYVKKEDIKNEK